MNDTFRALSTTQMPATTQSNRVNGALLPSFVGKTVRIVGKGGISNLPTQRVSFYLVTMGAVRKRARALLRPSTRIPTNTQ